MPSKSIVITAVLVIGLAAVGLIALTALLVPENAHPAYYAATEFMNAAGKGQEETAFALLDAEMQTYVRENCPQGRVSNCVSAYIPPEWGGLISAEFRRALPDGEQAWDVLLFATYEEDRGFTGVCIYNRVEQQADQSWRVAGWSGFIWCGQQNAGLQELRSANAPNQVP